MPRSNVRAISSGGISRTDEARTAAVYCLSRTGSNWSGSLPPVARVVSGP